MVNPFKTNKAHRLTPQSAVEKIEAYIKIEIDGYNEDEYQTFCYVLMKPKPTEFSIMYEDVLNKVTAFGKEDRELYIRINNDFFYFCLPYNWEIVHKYVEEVHMTYAEFLKWQEGEDNEK